MRTEPIFTYFNAAKAIRFASMALAVCAAALVVLHIAAEMLGPEKAWQLLRSFSMDREGNVPTWFTSMLLLGVAVSSIAAAILSGDKLQRNFWIVFAAISAILSCDEVAQFHENISYSLQARVSSSSVSQALGATAFIYASAPFIIGLLIFLSLKIRTFICDAKKSSKIVLAGIVAYFAGAVFIELAVPFIYGNAWYFFETVLEESLEIFGAIFCLYGIWIHSLELWAEETEFAYAA